MFLKKIKYHIFLPYKMLIFFYLSQALFSCNTQQAHLQKQVFSSYNQHRYAIFHIWHFKSSKNMWPQVPEFNVTFVYKKFISSIQIEISQSISLLFQHPRFIQLSYVFRKSRSRRGEYPSRVCSYHGIHQRNQKRSKRFLFIIHTVQ